jgi:hypothetical protein
VQVRPHVPQQFVDRLVDHGVPRRSLPHQSKCPDGGRGIQKNARDTGTNPFHSTVGVGIKPDIEVAATIAAVWNAEDLVLQATVKRLAELARSTKQGLRH